jgi:heme exporter protein B
MNVGTFEAFALLVRRELCLSFRRPDQLLQPLVFFLIVTTLFPLGLSLQLSLLRDMAPGVLWVAALLSSLLSLDALFKSDADDGTLEQLALSGQGLTLIVIAKTFAHWLVTGVALVLVSPVVATALGIPGSAFATMMLSLGLGTLTLSWLGAIGAAMCSCP